MNATISLDANHGVEGLNALESIAERVLWLSTSMVHHANRVRPNASGLKVGGHQASSASMVSIMTSLWFGQLQSGDRVSVKPHASPVLHSINYLLGELERKGLIVWEKQGRGYDPFFTVADALVDADGD